MCINRALCLSPLRFFGSLLFSTGDMLDDTVLVTN